MGGEALRSGSMFDCTRGDLLTATDRSLNRLMIPYVLDRVGMCKTTANMTVEQFESSEYHDSAF